MSGQYSSVLQQLTQDARQLYSLPAVATEILRLAEQPQCDLVEIKWQLERDPALAAKILRVVNSSFFGMSRRVSDLQQALALLGVQPLKMLVLGFSLPSELFAGLQAERLSWYWRRSLTKAIACRELAQRFWKTSGEEPFIAGLLQDLGVLVLLQRLDEPYARFLNEVSTSGSDLAAMETMTLGFDHSIVSARLLDHWEFPRRLVDAIALPLDSERLMKLPTADQPLPQILHLGDLIARLLTDDHPNLLDQLLVVAKKYRPITPAALHDLLLHVQSKVTELAQLFSISPPEPRDFTRILTDAHQQLSDLVETAIRVGSTSFDTLPRLEPPRLELLGETPSGPTLAPAKPPPSRPLADPGLELRIETAAKNCWQSRQHLTLLLAEIDRFDDLLVLRGIDHIVHLLDLMEAAVESLANWSEQFVRISDSRFALVLSDVDRQRGVDVSRELARDVNIWSQCRSDQPPLTVSVGVASAGIPLKNFDSRLLITAAERCLFAASNSGGNTVKSIYVV